MIGLSSLLQGLQHQPQQLLTVSCSFLACGKHAIRVLLQSSSVCTPSVGFHAHLSVVVRAGLVVHALLWVHVGNGADSVVVLGLGVRGWQVCRRPQQLLEHDPLLRGAATATPAASSWQLQACRAEDECPDGVNE